MEIFKKENVGEVYIKDELIASDEVTFNIRACRNDLLHVKLFANKNDGIIIFTIVMTNVGTIEAKDVALTFEIFPLPSLIMLNESAEITDLDSNSTTIHIGTIGVGKTFEKSIKVNPNLEIINFYLKVEAEGSCYKYRLSKTV